MESLVPWFALKSIPGIGNLLFKRLTDRFGSPEQVFTASEEELLEVEGISPRLAAAVRTHSVPDYAAGEIALALQKGYRIVTLSDPEYPPLLLQIPDPPPFLYVYGDLSHSARSIAVVGTRNATRYGISAAIEICQELAALNITVVSGMARGIDTAAHDGALMGGGKTIAVLGSGLERVYPLENMKLFHKIAQNGAVISEFHLTEGPAPHHFPIRNRIISGISLGTLVVEAARKSGALITAEFALEQGREVFAVPGSIRSFKSTGPHNLIRQGAKLAVHAQDITEELPQAAKMHIAHSRLRQDDIRIGVPALSSEETLVLRSLSPYPVHIDELARKISMESGKLSSILMQLELKGMIQQSPGKLFSIETDNIFSIR